jgi:hypothetical protein
VWCYGGEVLNRGHPQFFFNSAGQYARETVEALRRVGASEFAGLLSEAITMFPEGHIPRDLLERNAALDKLPEESEDRWRELDDEFLRLDRDEAIMRKLLEYWRTAHA